MRIVRIIMKRGRTLNEGVLIINRPENSVRSIRVESIRNTLGMALIESIPLAEILIVSSLLKGVRIESSLLEGVRTVSIL